MSSLEIAMQHYILHFARPPGDGVQREVTLP
jgi:hypothetical protein